VSTNLARVPSGVQVVIGDAARLVREAERVVLSTFAGWSYEEVRLPMFDYAELFEEGLGAARTPRTYRFTDHEGRLLALRPELTTLVARTVATRMADRVPPLRLAYSGEVFRWDPPRRGQPVELHQVGLEHLGTDRLEADLEVLVVCVEALRALGLDGFRIQLSHVGFVQGIVDGLGLDADSAERLRGLLDHRDRDGVEAFLSVHSPPDKCRRFAAITTLSGGADVLDEAAVVVNNATSRAALADLRRILDAADAAGLTDVLAVDLGGVAGFDYYTGLTFSVFAPGLGAAVGGGGRYDRLMSRFGLDLPAVGFSLCLDWLVELVAGTEAGDRLLDIDPPHRLANRDLASLFGEAARLRGDGEPVLIDAAGDD